MRGIDFSHSVNVVTLDPGTTLQQYVGKGVGNYFAEPGTPPLDVGVGDASDRTLTLFQNNNPISALQSTASNFVYPQEVSIPGAGGGTQFYIPDKLSLTPLQ